MTSLYGQDASSRIADPADPSRVFTWLLDPSYDDRGNAIGYQYKPEIKPGQRAGGRERAGRQEGLRHRYLKRIFYGNDIPFLPALGRDLPPLPDPVVLPGCPRLRGAQRHGADTSRRCPWACRADPFSTYRAGFEIRTYRACQRILMFHQFPPSLVPPRSWSVPPTSPICPRQPSPPTPASRATASSARSPRPAGSLSAPGPAIRPPGCPRGPAVQPAGPRGTLHAADPGDHRQPDRRFRRHPAAVGRPRRRGTARGPDRRRAAPVLPAKPQRLQPGGYRPPTRAPLQRPRTNRRAPSRRAGSSPTSMGTGITRRSRSRFPPPGFHERDG